jgi:hypothetical protein
MHELAILSIRTLEVLFAVGAVGAFLVILLTSIEDLREVFVSDIPNEVAEGSAPAERVEDGSDEETLLAP